MPIRAAAQAIGQTATNAFTAALNHKYALEREKIAREENYKYNEQAADNSDTRTRKLYEDLYSPQAQMQQIEEAGLSPSIYASGGIAGKSGVSGAQGQGAAGISPNVFGVSPIDMSQIMLNKALANKADSEADKNDAEKTNINLQNEYRAYINKQLLHEDNVNSLFIYKDKNDPNKGYISLYEYAKDCNTYEQFWNKVKETITNDNYLQQSFNTEHGQNALRNIYTKSHEFQKDIAVINQEETDALFKKGLLDALKQENFAKLSAKEQVAIIKANTENANLNEDQKKAWNDMLNKMGDGTGKDTVIILGMILSTLMGNTHLSASKVIK